MTITRQTALWTVRGGLALGAAVFLTACGSSANNAFGGPNGSGGEGGFAGQGVGGGQGGFGPGASGIVGAVSGSTAQVQNTQLNQQVAVTWTATTKFTQEVSASRSAVIVGSCVTVTAPRTSATSSATPATRPTSITAATVRITAATNGSCTAGGGRFGGQRPSGAPSGFGTPGAQPGGGQGRPGGFRAFGAFGKVTAVSASGFTVQSDFGGQTSTTAVTTTGSTTYSTTATATASAVKDGVCLQASGKADSTGAITATRVTVSQPVDGTCAGGFGPRG